MNRAIFREYDIRGVVETDLTPSVVKDLGKGFGTTVIRSGGGKIACGRDGRTHSEPLAHILMEGIAETGCDIVDIGQCPTPLMYFALHQLDVDGGIQITGSHNPPEFNGFKMCIGKAPFYGKAIQELMGLISDKDFNSGNGSIQKQDIFTPYMDYLKKNIQINRPIKIVIDAGNGVAGATGPAAFKQAGIDTVELFCDVDGTFPNHHPDPTVPKNLEALIKAVIDSKADAGIAYDGDGDRIGVVDETGRVIYGDKLLMIFARDILASNPGATVIGEVKCSSVMYDDIREHNGNPIMWKTGHSLIKQKMKETGALLAGEMSGHMFFADRFFGYDDAVYASLRLAEIIANTEKPLSSFLQDVPETFSTPEIRFDCPDELKFSIVKRAVEFFRSRYDVIDVDGVRLVFNDGWGLVRASNTQPVLVMRFEAQSKERLNEIKTLVEQQLQRIIEEIKSTKGN